MGNGDSTGTQLSSAGGQTMSSTKTRIMKEARALFWPWCVVAAAGAMRVALNKLGSTDGLAIDVTMIAFFVGLPLLATIPFGHEFQNRTLPILFSQPIGRMRIWREKAIVTMIAVLSTALIHYIGFQPDFRADSSRVLIVGGWLIMTIGSAMVWTFLARSTLTAVTATIAAPLIMAVAGVITTEWMIRAHLVSVQKVETAGIAVSGLAAVLYAGVMLWLGWRKLIHFQVSGEIAADLVTSGREMMPQALARWFRSRPSGPVLNLIRKELHLLRPLWLLTMFSTALLACIAIALRFAPAGETLNLLAWIAAMVFLSHGILAAMLAGSVSIGEERTLGTQAWHLTLPISPRRQWFIKLSMAILGAFGSFLLPALTTGLLSLGAPLRKILEQGLPPNVATPGQALMIFLSVYLLFLSSVGLLLTFSSFWCAASTTGTVAAVLWAPVAIGAVFVASRYGLGLGHDFTGIWLWHHGIFVSMTDALSRTVTRISFSGAGTLLMVVLPASLLALIQSCSFFRTQPTGRLSVLRYLLPVVVLTFGGSYILGSVEYISFNSGGSLERSIHEGVGKLHLELARLDKTHPLRIEAQEFAKVGFIPQTTRRLEQNHDITVLPSWTRPGYQTTIATHYPGGRFGAGTIPPYENTCTVYGPQWGVYLQTCRHPNL